MASSITHRATGAALHGGAVLLTLWFIALALGEKTFEPVNAFLGSPLGLVGLFGFAWSLIYHTLNGLRHLYWDAGRGLDPKTASNMSIAIFATSILSAIAVFAAGFLARGS
jgi:succinate dehydrogenase / fumarate reductase cytochrome b subunit